MSRPKIKRTNIEAARVRSILVKKMITKGAAKTYLDIVKTGKPDLEGEIVGLLGWRRRRGYVLSESGRTGETTRQPSVSRTVILADFSAGPLSR